jgi:hypothetical protein
MDQATFEALMPPHTYFEETMRKSPRKTLVARLSCAALLAVVACSPDSPLRPRFATPLQSALLEGPTVLAQAEAGTLGRGEQDFLVRFERRLPGFGGLYVSSGAVRVCMKPGTIPLAAVRNVLSTAYSVHPNPRVREAMANVSMATVIRCQYSLSELIAIQRRIESSISGWNGAGTNIMANRVVVAFPDSNSLVRGLSEMADAGIPAGALTSIVMPPFHTASTFLSSVRPTRAGVQIVVANETYDPHDSVFKSGLWLPRYHGLLCTLGFNVHASSGADYFLTAGHCENTYRGVNGTTGDTIFQPSRSGSAGSLAGMVGTIVINPAWNEGVACPLHENRPPDPPSHFDFCTIADVALGQYTSGITGEQKVGVSVTSGVNGNPGSYQINNWYPITGVLSPEYVDSTMHHQVHKSGAATFTTTGPFVADMMDIAGSTCWPLNWYQGCPTTKSILFQNSTVIKASNSGGDSGAPVFTGYPGQGAPYAALGILVAGSVPAGQLPEQPCPTCLYAFSRWDNIQLWLNVGTLSPATNRP